MERSKIDGNFDCYWSICLQFYDFLITHTDIHRYIYIMILFLLSCCQNIHNFLFFILFIKYKIFSVSIMIRENAISFRIITLNFYAV